MKILTVFLFLSFSSLTYALRPIALLPDDTTASIGQEIEIDGSSSFDTNNLTLSYRWSLDITPHNFNSQIDSPTNSLIRFTPNVEGFYLIRLIVSNGEENSFPAYMVIRVR